MTELSELPEVRRADCGHGFLPIDVPPAAWEQNGMHRRPVHLCEDCRGRLNALRVERKDITVATTKTVTRLPVSPELEADIPPFLRGEAAALERATEDDCPYPDRRTKEAKDWLRGFREAKDKRLDMQGGSDGHGERTGA